MFDTNEYKLEELRNKLREQAYGVDGSRYNQRIALSDNWHKLVAESESARLAVKAALHNAVGIFAQIDQEAADARKRLEAEKLERERRDAANKPLNPIPQRKVRMLEVD